MDVVEEVSSPFVFVFVFVFRGCRVLLCDPHTNSHL